MADTQATRRRRGARGKKPKARGGDSSSRSATVSERILKAVASGKAGRRGISLAALKKLLSDRGYDVAANKWRLRQAVRSLVSKGSLVQTSGSGASGSFKLPAWEEAAADRPARKPRKREPLVSPAASSGRGSRKAAVKRPKRRLGPRKMKRDSARKAVAKGGHKGAKSPGKRGRKAAAGRPARGSRKPRAKFRRGAAKPPQEQQQEEKSQAPAPEETSTSEKTSQACSEIAGNV